MHKQYSTWIIVVCILVSHLTASQTTSIPDSNFEQALIDLGIDSDGQVNGTVATDDISSVSSLDVSAKDIAQLTGIEDFSSLEELNCSNNILESLNLSENGELRVLDCNYSNGSETEPLVINVSNNAKLESLSCIGNRIESLSVRSNPELLFLRAGKNLISEINLSDNPKLEQVFLDNNLLINLNVRSNPNLKVLDCSTNLLQAINVTDNFFLERLNFASNSIPEIDLFENPYLAYLDISDNPLTSIILFNLIRLKEFHAEANDLLTRIDFDQTHQLEYISCHDNENLAVIELVGTTALKYLNCSNNLLTDLDLSQNAFLSALYCQGNDLTALDLSQNVNLAFLKCNDNLLENLNLKNGNNALLSGGITTYEGEEQYMEGVNALGNADLTCIEVDSENNALNGLPPYDSWLIEDFTSFAEDCQAALSVDEFNLDNSIHLYPNPFDEHFHLKSDRQPILHITVYSVHGSKMKDLDSEFYEVGMQELEEGVYFVRITLEKGSIVKTLIKS